MKAMILVLIGLSLNAMATVDGMTDVAIVTDKYGEGFEFESRKIPMLSCAGIHEESIAGLWTKPVNITASIGCGGPTTTQNINAGSCIKAHLEWDSHYVQLQKVTLDLGYCQSIWAHDWMSLQEQADIRDNFSAAALEAAKFNFGTQVPVEIR